VTIYSWVGAATRYLLLKRGVVGNTKISRIEDEVLQGEVVIKRVRRASSCDGQLLAHLHLLHPRDAVLAVDRLDFRQRGDGDDRGGDALAMRLPNPRWWRSISSTVRWRPYRWGRCFSW
jgi:hypothetical protein